MSDNRPRMRTAPQAIAELKKIDPDTAFTLGALKRMMKQGKIPVVMVESKRLINFDTLLDILSNGETLQAPESECYGIIRRIG